MKDLNVRPETIKLLEENISRTLSNINHSKYCNDSPPRIMKIKTKTNKWNLIKLKSFCTMKQTVSKVKRQLSKWERITVYKTTNKELTSKMHKQFMQLKPRKRNAKKKKKGMQIKTTMRCHLTLVRMAIIKKYTNSKCWRRYGEKGTSYTVGGNAN